jgi:hypothetical protein
MWLCASLRPGMTVRPPRSICFVKGTGQLVNLFRIANCLDAISLDCKRLNELFPVGSKDLSVEQDSVGRGGSGERHGAGSTTQIHTRAASIISRIGNSREAAVQYVVWPTVADGDPTPVSGRWRSLYVE